MGLADFEWLKIYWHFTVLLTLGSNTNVLLFHIFPHSCCIRKFTGDLVETKNLAWKWYLAKQYHQIYKRKPCGLDYEYKQIRYEATRFEEIILNISSFLSITFMNCPVNECKWAHKIIIYPNWTNKLTHSSPMHPFFNPWKHQKTVRFSNDFRG